MRALFLALVLVSLGACNTIKGLGKDVETVGGAVGETAGKVGPKIGETAEKVGQAVGRGVQKVGETLQGTGGGAGADVDRPRN